MASSATPDSRNQLDLVIEFLRWKDRNDVTIDDIIGLAETMAKTLDQPMQQIDVTLHEEFTAIAAEISSLKQEISNFGPDKIRLEHIPEAGRELDAVVETTEDAAHAIMEAAEAIMAVTNADPDAYRALVSDKVMEIFAACSFQDLTGQRVRKVLKTLTWIEGRIARLSEKLSGFSVGEAAAPEETEADRRARELMLHGPQLKSVAVGQDGIDDLFASSDQSDIDRLFG